MHAWSIMIIPEIIVCAFLFYLGFRLNVVEWVKHFVKCQLGLLGLLLLNYHYYYL